MSWRNTSGRTVRERKGLTVFEQGLGLFGSAEDTVVLDEVVATAYEERRRPTKPAPAL
jgi:hypothetical protein